MSGRDRQKLLTAASIVAMGFAGTASAGIPVLDVANLVSNVAQNFQLKGIKRALTTTQEGTINYYAGDISNHTENIDSSTKSIHAEIAFNTEINNEFTWIINKENGEEIIPIPFDVKPMLDAILNGESSDGYAAKFANAEDYYSQEAVDEDPSQVGFEGSRARKAANDALVRSIATEQTVLADEATALRELAEMSKTSKGHGHQLQLANAIAGSQVNQMMKLRSMMLVSEASRAAEAQSAADKDARAIAKSRRMRDDIKNMLTHTAKTEPLY